MSKMKDQHQGWVITTIITLSLFSMLYFVVIFPDETKNVISQYLITLIVVIGIVISLVLLIMLNNKANSKPSQTQIATEDKKVKSVEHLIWRNRYVLEATKTRLINEDKPGNRDIWIEEKANFARKYIFPVIPETAVSLEVISDLIEKSIRGGAIRGIRPPTYSVTDTND